MGRAELLPKRRPRRPSIKERVLGALLLAVTAGLVVSFAVAGARADPQGLPEPPARAVAEHLPLTTPGGWPRGAVEGYDPDTLFEKINGKADAYLVYDVAGLEFASYADPKRGDTYVDVYLYDMGAAINAYGTYRAQRTGKERTVSLGDEACAPGRSLFFRKGRFYGEVLASDDAALEQVKALASAVADALPAAKEPAADPPWFSTKGLRIVRYDKRNCLMVSALSDAYLAVYDDGAKVVVARYPDVAAAEAAAKAARENFAFLREDAFFVVIGSRLAGVVGSKDPTRLTALTKRLREER